MPPKKSIAVLSTNIRDGFPWVPSRNLVWTSHYPSLWFMHYVSSIDDRTELHLPVDPADFALANTLRRQTVDNLMSQQPDYIVLQSFKSPFWWARVDLMMILGKDIRFASFFSNYLQIAEFDKYILYSRKSSR